MITIRAAILDSGSRSRRLCRCDGFSLVELIMMIAILAAIVSVSMTLIGDNNSAAMLAKLESDVACLNSMADVYVADGGSLAGLSSPQAVLDKMKRYRPEAQWQQHVGVVSGKLLDVRLQARMTSQPDSFNTPRALWNRTKQRFELTQASGTAVSEFYLDNTLAGADYGSENRTKSVVLFNAASSGWVWGNNATTTSASYLSPLAFQGSNPSAGFNPNETAPASTTPPANSGGGSGGGSGGSGGGAPAQPTLALLPIPAINPSGGTFAFGSFPSYVTISGGSGTANVSTVMYSINGGAWQAYDGSNIPLTPAMTIQAYSQSTHPAEYASSNVNTQSYYRLTSGFSGTDVASWGNALGGPNLVTSIQNSSTTSTFQSGNTKLDLGNGQYLDAGVENSMSFTPASFATVTPNTWFDFGAMQVVNGTTFYNSEATGVTLAVNMNLTQPALSFTTYINLGLVSTPNTSDPLSSADIVQLLNPTTDFTVTIDGVQYRLQLQWVSLDPGSSVVQGNNLLVFEGANAAVQLQARFTSNY